MILSSACPPRPADQPGQRRKYVALPSLSYTTTGDVTFYLALARRESAPLVTADKRLVAAAQALPDVEVRLLGG